MTEAIFRPPEVLGRHPLNARNRPESGYRTAESPTAACQDEEDSGRWVAFAVLAFAAYTLHRRRSCNGCETRRTKKGFRSFALVLAPILLLIGRRLGETLT